jgi:hypothetical protein
MGRHKLPETPELFFHDFINVFKNADRSYCPSCDRYLKSINFDVKHASCITCRLYRKKIYAKKKALKESLNTQ